MKTLLVLLGVILLASCVDEQKAADNQFNRLPKPLVVTAKSKPTLGVEDRIITHLKVNCSITVKDSNGRYTTFDGSKGIGAALYSTYNVKDTIK